MLDTVLDTQSLNTLLALTAFHDAAVHLRFRFPIFTALNLHSMTDSFGTL